jgi:prevent-host-death family protein
MKRASITEAKNQLSALIDRVRRGETVLIEDRGVPVAQLQPVSAGAEADQARIARLVRAGVLRPAPESPLKDALAGPPPRLKRGSSGVAALLAEREEGR